MEENPPQNQQKVPKFGVSSELPGVPLNSSGIEVEKRLLRNLAKTTKKARIFYPCRTPTILEKEGKNAQKNKQFLEHQKSKEIQKGKEKKIREQELSLGQTGPLPGTNWDPSLGQTGRFLLNSTVKSPFCPVCPWDGWGFVLGTIVPQGLSEKVYVFSVYWFFAPNLRETQRVGRGVSNSLEASFLCDTPLARFVFGLR